MGKRILIADDEEVIRKFLKIHLSKLGHEVEEVVDGQEAIDRLKQGSFDLLICDLMMPNKTGWDVLKEVKSDSRLMGMPVIVLSARDEGGEMFRGYDMGASYYMTKPFTRAQLLYGLELMFGEGS